MKPTAVKLAFAIAFIASAWTADAQTSTSVCNDAAYIALRAIPVDSLSDREWELYRIHHAACLAEQARLAVAADPVRPFDGKRIKTHREGFWANMALSSARLNDDCPACGGYGITPAPRVGYTDGMGFSISAGGTLTPNLLLGGQIGGWAPMDDRDMAVVAMMVVAQYYPIARRGFHLTAAGGIGGIEFDEGDVNIHTEGTAFEVGVGWDLPMGKSGAITPFVSLLVIANGNDVTVTNAPSFEGPVNPRALSIGMKLALY